MSVVTLDIPKVRPDRTLQWVRVTISGGAVVCKDDAIRRDVEALKSPLGVSGADPEPDWTLADECKLWLVARIVEKSSSGNGQPPGYGVVV